MPVTTATGKLPFSSVFTPPSPLSDTYTVAFLGESDKAPTELSSLLETSDLVCLFLKAGIRDLGQAEEDLIRKLRRFLSQPIYSRVKFLWIDNPIDPLFEWRTHTLSIEKSGASHRVSALTYFDLHNYSFSIAKGCPIRLNDNKDGFLIERGGSREAFELSAAYGADRIFSTGDTVALPMTGAESGCLKFDLRIEKEGRKGGVFGYPKLGLLDLGFRMFFRDPNFPEAGPLFYVDSHRYPLFAESCNNDDAFDFYPAQLNFSVLLDPLNILNADRTYFQVLHPGNPPSVTTTPSPKNTLPSGFRTNMGRTVHLLPVDNGDSRLVFAGRTLQPDETETAPLYLTPSGDFEILIPDYGDAAKFPVRPENIICGVSGVEYFKLPAGKKAFFTFKPGEPAFAPGFVSAAALLRDLHTIIGGYTVVAIPDQADLDMKVEEDLGIDDTTRLQILDTLLSDYFPDGYRMEKAFRDEFRELERLEELVEWLRQKLQGAVLEEAQGKAPLETTATTAWAYLKGEGIVYYAQPDQSILYKSGESPDFFEYLETPAVGLPQNLTNGKPTAYLPMLPYGNVRAGRALADLRELEYMVVSKVRRARIREIGRADGFATPLVASGTVPEITGVTPMGLLATFKADFETWARLTLANYASGKNKEIRELALTAIPHESVLRSVLQSNPLFLVISKKESLTGHFLENQLEIEGWNFLLGPQEWHRQDTILIFKFQDKPLLELAAQPELWSESGVFNNNTQATSRRLLTLLKEAVEKGTSKDPKERRKYENLARIAQAEAWTGIIALNVHVPLGGLPDELKALAAGMDANKFYAQYVGIDVTPVVVDGQGTFRTNPSSLFGLIDYKNEALPEADASGYNFHVPFLTVIFNNTKITDFAAEILIILDRLFDEPTLLSESTSGRNIVALKGTAERHNGEVVYSFGFAGANRFRLPDSKALEEVEIVKAQFSTDPIVPVKAGELLTIEGQFIFWGRLRFPYLEAFDILSFGRVPAATGETPGNPDNDLSFLAFSNLRLGMAFKLDEAANEIKNRTFLLNPGQLAFDLKNSGVRDHSLYDNFPLKLQGLRYVKNDSGALAGSGFMPVKSPLPKGTLGDTWYGLTYDLNLGSVGSLAGKAGIVVSILVAWSPSTVNPEQGIYIGLKLPGSSGGKKEMVIQGVLKIVFKSIEFVVYPLPHARADALPKEAGYLLKLKNIVVKFFVLSLPPSGQTEITIFGDPREVSPEDKLVGWYAAYAKK